MNEELKPSTETTATEALPPLVEDKVLVDKAYVIPAAGVEAVPLATLASIDFIKSGPEPSIFEMGLENTLGSVLVICAYQSLLTALKSETARRSGEITRKQQVQLICSTALASGKSSAFTLVLCSALIVTFPWLTPMFAVLGIVGGAAMATRVTQEFWSALDDKQQQELRNAAKQARVNLERIIPDPLDGTAPAPAGA